MSGVTVNRPWLRFDLGAEMQVLSWAINKPGFVRASRIIWREVRNADLPKDLNVRAWLDNELRQHGSLDAIAFLTSRNVTAFHDITTQVYQCTAQCVATVGLSNSERVGHRVQRPAGAWGTINVAVRLDRGLTQTGLIEALSIATQARTAAIMDAGLALPAGKATGTGTDCIAVAAPVGPDDYAGLHTDIGEALGAAVYRATLFGARDWLADQPNLKEGTTDG
ncbi:adenosylcobinamide amidohydrolase [Yoonia sp. GPGPB17]|uniref:adenosylcobinamide amidohydrolase n=1 Tax=Yoonia sp. GPGPB17 TaxID=3026147 RepID=UPI0030BEDA3F